MYRFGKVGFDEAAAASKGVNITSADIFRHTDYNLFGEFYGKCRTLFGEPNKETKEYEYMYIYCIKATAEDGSVLYFILRNDKNGPAVSYPADDGDGTESPYISAVRELLAQIAEAPASDYSWKGHTTEGYPIFLDLSVVNGEPRCSPFHIDERGLLETGLYFKVYEALYKEYY